MWPWVLVSRVPLEWLVASGPSSSEVLSRHMSCRGHYLLDSAEGGLQLLLSPLSSWGSRVGWVALGPTTPHPRSFLPPGTELGWLTLSPESGLGEREAAPVGPRHWAHVGWGACCLRPQEQASVPGWSLHAATRSNMGQGDPHRLPLPGGGRTPNPNGPVLPGAVTSASGLGLGSGQEWNVLK